MTLKKAIEILELNLLQAGKAMPPDCRDAVQLSIEADRAVIDARANNYYTPIPTLPGETEE